MYCGLQGCIFLYNIITVKVNILCACKFSFFFLNVNLSDWFNSIDFCKASTVGLEDLVSV